MPRVQNVVLNLNLCPFAHTVVRNGDLSLHVSASTDVAEVLALVAEHAELLVNAGGQATKLIVLPNGFVDFLDYLDLIELADELLVSLELDGLVQIASFHPRYQFDGSDPDDNANFTNRSPYPMLHLLQEEAVSTAIAAHPDVHSIPERNIELMDSMQLSELQALAAGQHEAGCGAALGDIERLEK